jgi:hypothetical protein
MVRSDHKLVVAWTHAQARHFAKSMDWTRAEWTFVRDARDLLGKYGMVVYDVRAPRYKPLPVELNRMEDIQEGVLVGTASGRIVKLNVVNLP